MIIQLSTVDDDWYAIVVSYNAGTPQAQTKNFSKFVFFRVLSISISHEFDSFLCVKTINLHFFYSLFVSIYQSLRKH